jgi:4,5:9,10-diseco-3-hydroxy-5,9,17-trioxoandrosta-1(10),2-diene-4-oate hydrolase
LEKKLIDRRFVEIGDGLSLHYAECGEGPPVIFVHGSGPGASGHSNFADNMRAFARAGFRAIAVDLLGYGDSSKPTDKNYTLDLHVPALKQFVDKLKLSRVSLVGNSLGGAVSMRFAMDYPEFMDRLVLLAPGGLAPRLRYLRMPGIQAMMWSQLGPGGPTFKKLQGVFDKQLFDPSQLSRELVEQRFHVALTQPRQVYKTLKVDNLVSRLGEIHCPTLVFWGTDDKFCPVDTAIPLTQGVADCRTILIARCGHWAQVEHPRLFNREAISFLSGDAVKGESAVEALGNRLISAAA